MVGLSLTILPMLVAPAQPTFSCEAMEPTIPTSVIQRGMSFADRLLDLTNAERAKAGLAPLALSPDLSNAAQWMASDMAANNYFDHMDRLGRRIGARAYDSGYRAWKEVGENIGAGQDDPDHVFADWMASPSHRRNLLRREFTELGLGFAENRASVYGKYWVQAFGTRPAYVTGRSR